MHQTGYSSMILHHIEGVDIIMADIISRAFKLGIFLAASHDSVSYFNTNFPLIQNESWHKHQVPSNILSCVTKYLLGKMLPIASLLRQT